MLDTKWNAWKGISPCIPVPFQARLVISRVHESEFRSVIRFLREGWEGIGRNFIYSGEQKFESIVIQRDRGRGRGRRRVSE